jgi:CPA1 family monovalent cation:H+ antiporter
MADRPTPDRLRAMPVFAGLGDAALERVAGAVTVLEVPAGQVLVEPRQAGVGMFVVEDGTVSVELRGRTLELGAGEVFGELALLVPEATRAARVRAATTVRCLALSRQDFLDLVETEPTVALAMLQVLARRLLREIGADVAAPAG